MEESIKKAKTSLGLIQTQRTLQRQELREVWNKRLVGPLAFAPSELRGCLSEERLLDENRKFAQWAAGFLKAEFRDSPDEDRTRRQREEKLAVGVGFGKGYDANWLKEAALAGLSTRWVDVSDVACDWARDNLDAQWLKAPYREVQEPVVIEGEIQELLTTEPDPNLDQEKVEIWYLCRLIGCLREETAFQTVELVARSLSQILDPQGTHKIVIVAAFREDNPTRVAKTSNLYERKDVLASLERGAERKVKVLREEHYDYFGQDYTALTVQGGTVGEEK